jgi:hypothetical protein
MHIQKMKYATTRIRSPAILEKSLTMVVIQSILLNFKKQSLIFLDKLPLQAM